MVERRHKIGHRLGLHVAVLELCGFQCMPPTHTELKPPTILR